MDITSQIDEHTGAGQLQQENATIRTAPGDKRSYIGSLTIQEQWEYMTEEPTFLRFWHTASILLDLCLCSIVYVYGWRLTGMPWAHIIPSFLYIGIGLGFLVAYRLQGPTTPFNVLGPPEGILQLYIAALPLFQQVHEV